MELVRASDRHVQASWSQRDRKAVRHKLPHIEHRPLIDYGKLQELCEIPGLRDRNNPETSVEAHENFMKAYSSVFVQPEKKKGLPVHSISRSTSRQIAETSAISRVVGGKTLADENSSRKQAAPAVSFSHDIRDYLPLLHRERKSEKPEAIRAENMRTLRRILRKLSFERTAAENEQVFDIVKDFPSLAGQVTPAVLKELCVIAHLDVWKEPDVTVFGNSGWHMVLRGSVLPQTDPYHIPTDQEFEFRSPTPEPKDELEELGVGQCFGTLKKMEGRDPNSRILTVMTLEPNCEFLKISCSDYNRVVEQIRQRGETEKVNLLQSCKTFELWSRQPLVKVANVLTWNKFPGNTVLVSEGYQAPFVGIIRSGDCHVLRQVEAMVTKPNGSQCKTTKQVVMGKLTACQSFGEISLISGEPASCSIVTATEVDMACIESEALKELDEVTLQLLHQSGESTFGNLTQDDIHAEYVHQEMKRDWNQFKHRVVGNVLNSRGIRPGYGKWSK